jgi:hypothetical protein
MLAHKADGENAIAPIAPDLAPAFGATSRTDTP